MVRHHDRRSRRHQLAEDRIIDDAGVGHPRLGAVAKPLVRPADLDATEIVSENILPLVRGLREEDLAVDSLQLLRLGDASDLAGIARGLGRHHSPQPTHLSLVADPFEHLQDFRVVRRQSDVQVDIPFALAEPGAHEGSADHLEGQEAARHPALDQDQQDLREKGGTVERRSDMLPAADRESGDEGRHDAVRSEKPGHHRADRKPVEARWPERFLVEQPRGTGDRLVVGQIFSWIAGRKGGKTAAHQPGIPLPPQLVEIDSHLAQPPRRQVFHNDIGLGEEPQQAISVAVPIEVEGCLDLPPGKERIANRIIAPCGPVHDPDHLGPLLRQDHAGDWSRDPPPDLDDAQALEQAAGGGSRFRGHGSPWVCRDCVRGGL